MARIGIDRARYGWLALMFALVFFGACKPAVDGSDPGVVLPDSTASQLVPSGVLSVSLAGTKALATVSVGQPKGFGQASARAADSSPLVKILEGGSIEDVLKPGPGVTLPEIDFIAVHPVDQALYISFKTTATLGTMTATFLRVNKDETVEIIESEKAIYRIATEGWRSAQNPVAFTDDGSIYYAVSGTAGVSLRRFAKGVSTTFSPNAAVTISRFFSDGSNLFFLGQIAEQLNTSTFLKVYNPVTNDVKTLMQTVSPECWVKDVFMQGKDIILSGWNITDPELASRRYDGIVRLRYDSATGKSEWFQVYGWASDFKNAQGFVNRRQLKARYFKDDAGALVPQLQKDFVAPFFKDSLVPDGIKYFDIVDIDKVTLDAARIPSGTTPQLEHKFWYGLLSDKAGFDADYYYGVFLNRAVASLNVNTTQKFDSIFYPPSANNPKSVVFDGLFGSVVATDYSFSGTGVQYSAAVSAQTTDFFSSISLKAGTTAPLSVFWTESDNMAWFKTWLDENFTYTLKSGVSLNVTTMFYPYLVNGEYLPTTLYRLYVAFTGNVYTAGPSGLRFRDLLLDASGAVNEDLALAHVKKFFPSAVAKGSLSPVIAYNMTSNSDANKAIALESLFTLGEPRISAAQALKFPPIFYDSATDQGLVHNPYLTLVIGTLFDSFSNLERFSFDPVDGSLFGAFRSAAGIKLVKLMDGPTGDISSPSVVVSGLNASGYELVNGKLYYSELTTTASGLYAINFSDGVKTTIVSPDEGLELYRFGVVKLNTGISIVFSGSLGLVPKFGYIAPGSSTIQYGTSPFGVNESKIEFY